MTIESQSFIFNICTGYFWWDQRIIYSIKLKCDKWLPFDCMSRRVNLTTIGSHILG